MRGSPILKASNELEHINDSNNNSDYRSDTRAFSWVQIDFGAELRVRQKSVPVIFAIRLVRKMDFSSLTISHPILINKDCFPKLSSKET